MTAAATVQIASVLVACVLAAMVASIGLGGEPALRMPHSFAFPLSQVRSQDTCPQWTRSDLIHFFAAPSCAADTPVVKPSRGHPPAPLPPHACTCVRSLVHLGQRCALRSNPRLHATVQVPLCVIVGLLCGSASVVMADASRHASRGFRWVRNAAQLPAWALPPLGGLVCGALAMLSPEITYRVRAPH